MIASGEGEEVEWKRILPRGKYTQLSQSLGRSRSVIATPLRQGIRVQRAEFTETKACCLRNGCSTSFLSQVQPGLRALRIPSPKAVVLQRQWKDRLQQLRYCLELDARLT